MTHDEIVKRRTLKKEQILRDNPSYFRKSKPDAGSDRPQSMAQTKTPKESALGRSSKKETLASSTNRDRSKSKVYIQLYIIRISFIDKNCLNRLKKDQGNKELTINEKQSGSKLKTKEKDSNPSVTGASTLKKDKTGRETSSK